MKIGILEDEIMIAEHLGELVKDKGFELSFSVSTVEEVKRKLTEQIDLLLLDIKVPGIEDGVDLANYINHHHQIPFLYISSNTDDKTRKRVLDSKPLGFISKPFKNFDVEIAIDLALEKHANDTKNDFLFVKDKGAWIKICLSNLCFLRANDNYTLLQFKSDSLLITKNLKYFEEHLSSSTFCKIHRSYLVNLNHIQSYSNSSVKILNTDLPVSDSYRENLKNMMVSFVK